MISAISITLFKDLAQCNYNNQYYDFHNNYSCDKILYSDGILLIILKSLVNEDLLVLKFADVKLNVLVFFNVKEEKDLTIDNLYRGRGLLNGDLIEMSEDGKAYFYLEFYEGQKLEFWAKSMSVEPG